MLFLVITKNQPREIKSAKIRLITQRREILTQVIKVEVVLRFFKLPNLVLGMANEIVEYIRNCLNLIQ